MVYRTDNTVYKLNRSIFLLRRNPFISFATPTTCVSALEIKVQHFWGAIPRFIVSARWSGNCLPSSSSSVNSYKTNKTEMAIIMVFSFREWYG